MQREEIKSIIKKYRKLSDVTNSDEKEYQYIRFSEYLEENIRKLTDDDYETEEDILDVFNESESEFDDNWNEMLPVGDDEDAIRSFVEEEIYHLITNSAKNRFDYDAFEEYISGQDENVQCITTKYNFADKILWYMLMYLAMGEKPNIIASKIHCEILLSGLVLNDVSSLEKIIVDNVGNWEKEIEMLKMATEMLNSNFASVEQVYDLVSKVLSK